MAKRKSEVVDKPTKKPHKSLPETQFSICIPSTIISSSNAKNLQQITNIAYQISKILTIYNVPEIIILDVPSIEDRNNIIEKQSTPAVKLDKKIKFNEVVQEEELNDIISKERSDKNENNSELFANLLQYFITPPYLTKPVFKPEIIKKFTYADKFPKISTLPFMNNNEVSKNFKEGITIAKKSPGKKKKNKLKVTKYVNIGESKPFELSIEVPVNVRVTVDLINKKIVSPLTAYGTVGSKSSFGYFTRIVKTFNELFTKSAIPEGYTSSVYIDCDNYFSNNGEFSSELPTFTKENNKVLLVFGNPKDLEFSFNQDKSLDLPDFKQLFDKTLSIPTNIRIEDAVMIALTKLYNP
ncbi:putative methyltransferase [[Candida] jaroonii]|uniref:Methyltransferase n=1 Tax=[Candida] jaroonii TaxID=467808 RepID=A0ACA9YD51_9ASCO|nr:putative methyltransferase [[Candida] jaroonii]